MPGRASWSIREFGTQGKLSNAGVWLPTLNAGNIVAQLGLVADIRAAIADVILGEIWVETVVAQETSLSTAIPADENAQRKIKWHVSLREVGTGNPASIELPTAKLTGLLDPNGEDMLASAPEYTALVAAIEAGAKTNDGTAVTVERIYVVGRSI